MPRRREVPKRTPQPDAIYNSRLVSKFINCLMVDGKKAVSERLFYASMDQLRESAETAVSVSGIVPPSMWQIQRSADGSRKPVHKIRGRGPSGVCFHDLLAGAVLISVDTE